MTEKQPPKFLLLGLPGTGKTTTFKACIDLLKHQQGINNNLILTDELINTRMKKRDDKIILEFEHDFGKEISPNVFDADKPSVEFLKLYTEPTLCDLEELFLLDIFKSSNENDWLDFGGRALMYPNVVKTLRDKNIIFIFLYAEPETIISHLNEHEGW